MPLLANPFSGSGPNRRFVDRLVAELEAGGLEPALIWDADERRAVLSDPQLAEKCRCVVVAGGDGTLADIVNELSQNGRLCEVPLAVLPLGNENLFAREFGFSLDAALLAGAIVRGQTRSVDVGVANGRVFTLVVSSGFDADVAHRLARWRDQGQRRKSRFVRGRLGSGTGTGGRRHLRRVGRLSYVPRILASALWYRYPSLTVDIDDQRQVTGHQLLVFNLPQYGMDLRLAPDARGDDGLLDWIVFERPGRMAMLLYALSVMRLRHLDRPDVHHGRAKRIRVSSPSAVPVEADGDPAGQTPIEIEVRPAALRLVVI